MPLPYSSSMSSRKQAFLVKLWVDGDRDATVAAPARAGARGSVEHLASKRRLYFNEMAQLVEFLSTNTSKRNPD